jgi:DNA-binding beta-propeller fold protein YncE
LKIRLFAAIVSAAFVSAFIAEPRHASADAPTTPIVVPGGPGHFDWMNVDNKSHRLFASHPGTKSIVVLDLTTYKAQSIDCGSEVNGIAVDAADNKIFAGGGGQNIVVLDNTTYAKLDTIPLTGPADAIVFDSTNATVYADHDDGTEIWTIDAKTNKVTGSIAIAGAPEFMQLDRKTQTIYQNIKPADQVQAIDLVKGTVTATWSTKPATSPHGLAYLSRQGWVLSAGKNGKLVAIDKTTGNVAFSCDIKPGVDQIAFDGKTRRVFCACKGFVSVVSVTPQGLTNIGDIAVPDSAHTLAIDPASHAPWISYSDKTNSYLALVDIGKLPAAEVAGD